MGATVQVIGLIDSRNGTDVTYMEFPAPELVSEVFGYKSEIYIPHAANFDGDLCHADCRRCREQLGVDDFV